jgi:hypothetical protein
MVASSVNNYVTLSKIGLFDDLFSLRSLRHLSSYFHGCHLAHPAELVRAWRVAENEFADDDGNPINRLFIIHCH